MLETARGWLLDQLRAAKPSFISKKPHFNFISAHYFWIVSLTILGSILIFASAGGQLAYIDALYFASGANTQAGLNTVDVNLLNTFQQACLYFFTMTSNPITIHSSVVFLRLYWFEKRFQGVVREARQQRRNTISKSKSRARDDLNQAERGRLSVRNIKVMHTNGHRSRMTNDGILLDMKEDEDGRISPGSNGFVPVPNTPAHNSGEHSPARAPETQEETGTDITQGRITFAQHVFRSDGTEPEVKLPSPHSPAHFAILERQRAGPDETLRIPNPRDAEKGMKPKRVEDDAAPEPEDERDGSIPHIHVNGGANNLADDVGNNVHRPQTIKIEEPERPRDTERTVKDEIADEAEVIGRTIFPFSLRKPKKFFKGTSSDNGEGSSSDNPLARVRSKTFDTIRTALTREKVEDMPYLSFTPTMGRNSAFPGLTIEQREELGGIEYRSLRTLAVILLCYFWGFSLFAITCFLPWIYTSSNAKYAAIVENSGVSKAWWGIFTANSAFNDLGLTLTPDSMNSFNDASFILLIMSFLIIIGNTGFPIMLRVVIWILSKIVPKRTGLWEELRFLLDHPRRCFTLLFPAGATWWLFIILIGLNVLDLLFFVLLDLNDNAVSHLPVHVRIVDGIFQAASTRTAGFSVVNISLLHPAVQVSYMIMMYISVFPIAISIRRTNVYEERSLGVYHSPDEDMEGTNENSAWSYVGTHLRRQLSFDLWYVFLGLFILAITEGKRIQNKDFDVYSVLFEIVSAYGTVGLSLGYPNVNASLCSQFTTGGKLIMIAMQIRGRHRGLPYGLDRAVLLPSESRFEKEAAEAQPVLVRSATAASTGTALSATRSNLRSRRMSTNRGQGIFTQFLHPGPVIPHEDSLTNLPRRSRSFGVDERPPMAEDMRRRNTEPVDDETTDTDSDVITAPPRRVVTTPARPAI
ncbi:trk family potassium uptake protein [Colletotrichum scovillei]|uniref:Potassium transport protein n=1 Tax=Colletotrichum scovillei TaxID=1209932 RepID=A0A9P7R6M0_9PEZI|nr:trk family potassium uptake protein [Colletotrichum scovillei]KAF4783514.1 trk family potassium uptake protein [Colletotrichum scovillei]KAG7051121.1 trk family potassium uptake protein [Colletotrichum scovillei]KAG7070156.1 trk family potassium uptake protein [Colletotrichum scovillei]KAG7078440.1 trk family potassium uptake protein [Colletotrichum scovillei]